MKTLSSKIEKVVLVLCALVTFGGIIWSTNNLISNFAHLNHTQVFDLYLFTGMLVIFKAVIIGMLSTSEN
jgi:hypothetical protein